MIPRRGYTAIELLVVLGIMVLLLGMSTPPVLAAMRRQAATKATAHVLSVHDRAQNMAMSRYEPTDRSHYGVVLVQDPGQPAWVALISGTPSDGPHRDRVLLNSRSQPVARAELPRAIDVWLAGQKLSTTTTREIAWYYQYRTGLPIAMSVSGPGRTPINVGALPETAGTATSPMFGLTINGQPYVVGIAAVAPDADGHPGLSFRSSSGSAAQLRRALAIYASGITNVVEY